MSTAKTFAAAALVAATLVGTLATPAAAAPPFPHPHHHHDGWGWGAGGLAAGLVIGSAIAASSTARAYEEPVRRCMIVERVNRWGDVVGTRRVCRWE